MYYAGMCLVHSMHMISLAGFNLAHILGNYPSRVLLIGAVRVFDSASLTCTASVVKPSRIISLGSPNATDCAQTDLTPTLRLSILSATFVPTVLQVRS